MPKKKDEVELDPVVTTVHKSLEETVTYFMGHLSDYLQRYTEKLKVAMPHNPKACHYYWDPQEIEEEAKKRIESGVSSPKTGRGVADFDAKKSSKEGLLDGQVKGVAPEEPSRAGKVKRGDRSPSPPKKAPTSPLLRRPKLDPALEAEMQANHLNMYSPVASANTGNFPPVKAPSPVKATADGEAKSADVEGDGNKEEAKELTDKELWAQVVPPPLLIEQLASIKHEARLMWKTFDRIHDWLALNIPTMSTEDNAGVGVMGAVITELSEVITLSKTIYSLEMKYLSERSEIETKVIKYQGAESFKNGLAVYDANTWDDIERGWRSLMRGVLLVHSVLAKNMKVLKEPRKKRDVGYMLAM